MTWLKVKEAARLLDLTDSAIKKAIKKNKYEFRHVIMSMFPLNVVVFVLYFLRQRLQGDFDLNTAPESFPQEVQDK